MRYNFIIYSGAAGFSLYCSAPSLVRPSTFFSGGEDVKTVLCKFSVVLCGLALLCACDSGESGSRQEELPVASETFSVEGAEREVLILSQGTLFKERLRSGLVEELNSTGTSVFVDAIDNHTKYDPEDYDAVILLSGIEAFRPLPEAPEFINTHDYQGNIVYVSTHYLFAVPYGRLIDKKKVDAVTSASKPDERGKVEKTKEEIISRLAAIF